MPKYYRNITGQRQGEEPSQGIPYRSHGLRRGATLVKGDVTNKRSVLEGMKGCDWVFNLADIYTLWLPDKRAYRGMNLEGRQCAGESAEVGHFQGDPSERMPSRPNVPMFPLMKRARSASFRRSSTDVPSLWWTGLSGSSKRSEVRRW